MAELALVPQSEFAKAEGDLPRIADLCRLNALTAVKRAGSGHIGSSFSAMDIVVFLLHEHLNTVELGFDHPDRDVYFSSKGHDVPGLYAVLHSLGVLPTEKLLRLRRLDGLDGHPNVRVPGIEANSGSLGMGISKGRGIAWAKRQLGHGGRVVVMVGDGELQEGQNFEALQGAAHDRLSGLTVVVDRNELQSDKPTEEILALGDLEGKLAAFGWHVASCDGHDFAELRRAFSELAAVDDRPQVLVARTIKGRGVSFMEHPVALREGGGTYRWHAGAPDDESFERARDELLARLEPVELEPVPPLEDELPAPALEAEPESGAGTRTPRAREYVVEAYGEALVELAEPQSRPRRARRGSRLRLPRARVRGGVSGALPRVRDRRAGHGLRGRRARPPRSRARCQLVRELPRLARERADLQQRERGLEGRLRHALRGAHPRWPGHVAPEPA